MILLPLTPYTCITDPSIIHKTELLNPSNEKTKTTLYRQKNKLTLAPEEQAMVPAQHFPAV